MKFDPKAYYRYSTFIASLKERGYTLFKAAIASGYIANRDDACKIDIYTGLYGTGYRIYRHLDEYGLNRNCICEYWIRGK